MLCVGADGTGMGHQGSQGCVLCLDVLEEGLELTLHPARVSLAARALLADIVLWTLLFSRRGVSFALKKPLPPSHLTCISVTVETRLGPLTSCPCAAARSCRRRDAPSSCARRVCSSCERRASSPTGMSPVPSVDPGRPKRVANVVMCIGSAAVSGGEGVPEEEGECGTLWCFHCSTAACHSAWSMRPSPFLSRRANAASAA